jgi:hypothetical protein
VTTGRRTDGGDVVTGRVCFYLEGADIDRIPDDRLDVTTSQYRIGKIRGRGPKEPNAMSSGGSRTRFPTSSSRKETTPI